MGQLYLFGHTEGKNMDLAAEFHSALSWLENEAHKLFDAVKNGKAVEEAKQDLTDLVGTVKNQASQMASEVMADARQDVSQVEGNVQQIATDAQQAPTSPEAATPTSPAGEVPTTTQVNPNTGA